MIFNRLVSPILLAVCLATATVTMANTEDEFYSGKVELYPEPVPVATVKRETTIPQDELSMAFRKFPEAVNGVKNTSVSVRVSSVESVDNGVFALKVTTVWKNIRPKQKVDKKSLEGKADRTMGAGGLFFGSAKGGSKASQMVEKDVAYTIPKWGDHMFLLADGIAYPVDAGSASLTNGTDPASSFTIARYGQEVELRSLFKVPRTAKNIALQLFDYSNGNIQIPLFGDIALARGKGYPKEVTAKAAIGSLDMGIAAVKREQKVGGIEADKGWTHLVIDLVGKSNYRKGGKATIAQIDTEKYLWLEGDGGFVYPVSWVQNGSALVRLTPEVFSSEVIGFLVPDSQTNFLLAIRDGGNIARLPLSDSRPIAPPHASASFKDGGAAEWKLFSVNKIADGLIVDMGIQGLDQKRGIEIDPFRQVLLAGKEGRVPDRQMTEALAFGPASKVVVSPGGLIRFVLAFKSEQAPVSLHIHGVRSEGKLALQGVPAGDLKQLSLAAPTQAMQALAMRKKKKAHGNKIGPHNQTKRTAAVAEQRQRRKAVLEAYKLPVWNLAGALQEKEQGEGIEHAIDLSKALVAKGSIGGDDREDYYYLDIQGKPRLWGIEVAGASVSDLSYVDASRYEQQRVSSDSKTGVARLINLLLPPGRHWIKVTGSRGRHSEYQLRAIRLGEAASNKEFEPNDDTEHANRLLVNESRAGLINQSDADVFKFSTHATEHLRLMLETSEAMRGRFYISGDVQVSELIAKKAGESVVYEGMFPPGDYLVRVRSSGSQPSPESYRVSLSRLDPFVEPGKTGNSLSLLFEAEDGGGEVAAYWPQAQQLRRRVRITNQGQGALTLTLKAWTSQDRWHAVPGVEKLVLKPGETRKVDVDILVEADAAASGHIAIAVAAMDQQGGIKSYQLNMSSVCGARPVHPLTFFSPPEPLLGGLNGASKGLGAKAISEKWQSVNSIKELFDGMTPAHGGLNIYGFEKEKPDIFSVRLAGNDPVRVKGFALNPMGGCSSQDWVKEFEIELSSDGVNFEKTLRGTLKRLPKEQYFVLQKPQKATHARLHVLSSHAKNGRRVCLGEWKVIADPATTLHPRGINIADPQLGGHVVWRSFDASDYQLAKMLSSEKPAGYTKMFSDRPNDWVIGFQEDRMARIASLEWKSGEEKGHGKMLSKVRLAASRSGPTGPWEPMGEWQLDSQAGVSRFDLDKPVWARFIRLSAEVKKTDYYDLPAWLRIIEQPAGSDYRSIIGEWGHYSSSGPYERQSPALQEAHSVSEDGKNISRKSAIRLEFGKPYHGSVSLGRKTAWYRIDIPEGSNRLTWELTGDPALTVRPLLMTQDGEQVSIQVERTSGRKNRYSADVKGGRSYLLQIEEPPRSIVIAWDNSGSMSFYIPAIYSALYRFAEQVLPGREYVNLLPFQDKSPAMLMESWSDQPFHIMQALNDYSRKDGSSDAELNLLQCVNELEEREGNRAVMIITDAESGQESGKPDLWEPISRVNPRMFSIEMHGGKPSSQDKMQDWSFVNNGHYSYFHGQSDLETGFERAVCMLRRPAMFSLVASANYEKPPGPGSIQVSMAKSAVGQTAIEIILDASGSMYKKLGKETRIGIAKSVLKELMQKSIPEGTPLALRIYGHRKARACDTKLEIPLRPFDPKTGIRVVDKADPKNRSRTPLAESLTLVAQDMKSAAGKTVVILLTDGVESCGGDPEKAIRVLREEGEDVRVNIVGLAIDSAKANRQFASWAKLGGGIYFEAKDREGLKRALNKALVPKFQLLDDKGDIIAEGTADGGSVSVPSGRYQLKVLTTPVRALGEVVISEGKTEKVVVKNGS